MNEIGLTHFPIKDEDDDTFYAEGFDVEMRCYFIRIGNVKIWVTDEQKENIRRYYRET